MSAAPAAPGWPATSPHLARVVFQFSSNPAALARGRCTSSVNRAQCFHLQCDGSYAQHDLGTTARHRGRRRRRRRHAQGPGRRLHAAHRHPQWPGRCAGQGPQHRAAPLRQPGLGHDPAARGRHRRGATRRHRLEPRREGHEPQPLQPGRSDAHRPPGRRPQPVAGREIQESLDDPRPSVPHDEVMAAMDAEIDAIERQRAGFARRKGA
jgi:hypothetical protein